MKASEFKTVEITVTVTPSLNAVKGRWGLTNWNKRYQRELRGYQYQAPKKRCRMALTITRHGPRFLDRDNMIGGCKSLIDAIRKVGLIVDDSPKWLDVTFLQEKCAGTNKKTTVVVRMCDDANFNAEDRDGGS